MAAEYEVAVQCITEIYIDWVQAESWSIRAARDHGEDCIEYHNAMEQSETRLHELSAMVTLTRELFPEHSYHDVMTDVRETARDNYYKA